MNWWRYTRKPSVREQRELAVHAGQRLSKSRGRNGRTPSPVAIEGRVIARSFWGKAWCENLESYRDYEYRLPRGRSYVRHGAVLDLAIGPGKIQAVVSGSRPIPYDVEITIKPLATSHWGRIKRQCAGEIGSLIELLEGRLSDRVMGVVTDREQGLFPKPKEIDMTCSCPDWATMCKHVAAVMYGIGARLDAQPDLLFTLRNVEHGELIAAASDPQAPRQGTRRKTIATNDLSSVFGIELAESPSRAPATKKRAATKSKRRSMPSSKPRAVAKSKARAGKAHAERSRRKKTSGG